MVAEKEIFRKLDSCPEILQFPQISAERFIELCLLMNLSPVDVAELLYFETGHDVIKCGECWK